MDLAYNLIRSSDKLSPHVVIENCTLGGNICKINLRAFDEETRTLWTECTQFIADRLSSEMRNVDNNKALQSCEEVIAFSSILLQCNVNPVLKIALFSELNVFGYMFDRSSNNYMKCARELNDFLNLVDEFKRSLSKPDLDIWNNSTYGGAEQVPFFRGYLQGIMAGN
ncbi:MAG: hypothetical protein SCH72_05635 [Desulfuromonadales bacterium]|nr:hypothetical protein [Desulfuromonadales bacterium]